MGAAVRAVVVFWQGPLPCAFLLQNQLRNTRFGPKDRTLFVPPGSQAAEEMDNGGRKVENEVPDIFHCSF